MSIELEKLIKNRFSARDFHPEKLVDDKVLSSLLEAARWAPSSYNDQPWSFIVTRRQDGEAFEKAISCLWEGNREWASTATLIIFEIAEKNYHREGHAPNKHAWHDMGMAVSQMALQGVALGLQMREMGGIDRDKIREKYSIPADKDIVAGLAMGYATSTADEKEGRERRGLDSFVYSESWGNPLITKV